MTTEKKKIVPQSHLLESTALAHVATLGPHGEPQSNPVWFGWDGEYVKFSQTKTRQKYKNPGREPRLALSIVDPENPLRYLEIEEYPNQRPGDDRVVVFVRPEHTTRKDG